MLVIYEIYTQTLMKLLILLSMI